MVIVVPHVLDEHIDTTADERLLEGSAARVRAVAVNIVRRR